MDKQDHILQIEKLMLKCGIVWEALAQKIRQPQWMIDAVRSGKVSNSTTINAVVNALKDIESSIEKKEQQKNDKNTIAEALKSTPRKNAKKREPQRNANNEKKQNSKKDTKDVKHKPSTKSDQTQSYVIYPQLSRNTHSGLVTKDHRNNISKDDSSELKTKLGNEIRHRRISLGKTIDEMAEYLKISTSILEGIERGEPTYSIFVYREVNQKLITGKFDKIEPTSGRTQRPRGYGSQDTRKEWTNVFVRRK